MTDTTTRTFYRITIQGRLKDTWAAWFNDMNVGIHNPDEGTNSTTMIIAVKDQAALRGLLNKIWDLNLTLISVTRQEARNW